MLIGIVGKSGAGKSTFVKRMQEFNQDIVHIDIDKIGQDILKNSEVVNNINPSPAEITAGIKNIPVPNFQVLTHKVFLNSRQYLQFP